jgi:hypothetical protein
MSVYCSLSIAMTDKTETSYPSLGSPANTRMGSNLLGKSPAGRVVRQKECCARHLDVNGVSATGQRAAVVGAYFAGSGTESAIRTKVRGAQEVWRRGGAALPARVGWYTVKANIIREL